MNATLDPSLAAFIAISVVVIVTPGQDTALTIRNTLFGGRRAGILTAVGVAAGQLAWTVAASAGITALLVASDRSSPRSNHRGRVAKLTGTPVCPCEGCNVRSNSELPGM